MTLQNISIVPFKNCYIIKNKNYKQQENKKIHTIKTYRKKKILYFFTPRHTLHTSFSPMVHQI